jgi:hypothetical protein
MSRRHVPAPGDTPHRARSHYRKAHTTIHWFHHYNLRTNGISP